MLRPLGAALGALVLAAPARGAEPRGAAPRAIREPVRLTAGASSELMGVLGAGGRALYFVSDASGTLDIMRQAPVQSGPSALSGGLGDAAWPQISPDGSKIAYISFESDATGDVCVRDISEREPGDARCTSQPASAALQVLWWDDASLAVLSRPGLHGNFQLVRAPLDGSAPSPLIARNMIGVAASPDRRWLAYIPVTKATAEVGITFAQRAAVGIGLDRLGAAGEPLSYVPPLPGTTGSVAFSEDGGHLLFTQFLNDTNGDGAIDGDDNAVVFRVRFDAAAASPIAAAAEPEQLTSARWDCHYPAPAPDRLIVSCSHEGSLDVYSLPLEGAVPESWDDARLVAESEVARDLWTQLLLAARRLRLAQTPATKEPIVLDMIGLHLELGELEAAIWYAENRLSSAEARRFGKIIVELARHRRADLALIRGETSAEYIESERARAEALRRIAAGAPSSAAQLAQLVISEIEEDAGDKERALQTFLEVDLAQLEDPRLVPIVARRAERLYRLRADRESLLRAYAALARLPILGVGSRLAYSQRFVAELGRGRSRLGRVEAIAAVRGQVDDASELALLLDVESVLVTLDDESQESAREQIFELYKQNKDFDRRRALVLATLRAAALAGNEYVQYQFVTSWASWLRRAHPERKYAEALYDAIVLDRAYGERGQGRVDEARGYFYGATLATGSLEAHIGFIEARIAEGGPKAREAVEAAYAKRFAREPGSPEASFVQAYLIARELPAEADPDRHDDQVGEAIELLARVAEALPKQAQVHQLWGFALHQRARRRGSREAAVDANRQYLLALDLARGDERLTATLLHRLGLLQASLGNHGAALRYLRQRDELPHVRPLEELGLRVALARSAWHSGDAALAREQMLAASELIARAPELGRFQALVVDRLGLSLATFGDAEGARSRYQELDALLSGQDEAAPLNIVKAKIGLAASALDSGQPEVALGALAAADRLLGSGGDLEPTPEVVHRRSLLHDYHYTTLQYRALIAGLRSGAYQAQGDLAAAHQAMSERVELLRQRLRESEVDEDRLELAQAYHHLARSSDALGEPVAAARAVESGLSLSDEYNENTGSEVNDAQLALIRDYAELALYRGLAPGAMRRDLRAELGRVYGVICKYRSPRWALERFLFKNYLTLLKLEPRR